MEAAYAYNYAEGSMERGICEGEGGGGKEGGRGVGTWKEQQFEPIAHRITKIALKKNNENPNKSSFLHNEVKDSKRYKSCVQTTRIFSKQKVFDKVGILPTF